MFSNHGFCILLWCLQCGSCWIFASVGTLEAANAIANGAVVPLSQQQVLDCMPISSADTVGGQNYGRKGVYWDHVTIPIQDVLLMTCQHYAWEFTPYLPIMSYVWMHLILHTTDSNMQNLTHPTVYCWNRRDVVRSILKTFSKYCMSRPRPSSPPLLSQQGRLRVFSRLIQEVFDVYNPFNTQEIRNRSQRHTARSIQISEMFNKTKTQKPRFRETFSIMVSDC